MIRTYAKTTLLPWHLFHEWYQVGNKMVLIDHAEQVCQSYRLKGVPAKLQHRYIKVPVSTVTFVTKWVPGKRMRAFNKFVKKRVAVLRQLRHAISIRAICTLIVIVTISYVLFIIQLLLST